MGLPQGYTATAIINGTRTTVPDIHRLQRIGGGIDIRSVQTLARRIAARQATPPRTAEASNIHLGATINTIADHVAPHTGWDTAQMAKWLSTGPLPTTATDDLWQHDWQLQDVDDLLRCCTQGFPLRYDGDRQTDTEHPNGATCQQQPEVTANELRKEIELGRILGPYATPPLRGFKSSPRGLKLEPTKSRPISQCNLPEGASVNDGIAKAEHIQLTRAQDMERKITQTYARTGQVWMAKADIKAAYRTMMVRPEDWHLQGIKWNGQYFIDTRMSFGCRSSVDQWLRFSDALAWALLRWGVHALHYVDDFIFIAGSEAECHEQVRKFRTICTAWGVELKVQRDCGPAQKLTALGVEYDLKRMTRQITVERVAQLADMLRTAKTDRTRPHWERMTGILWYVIRCVPLGTPHLQPIMEATLRARKQRKPIAPTATTMAAVAWWTTFLETISEQHDNHPWHGTTMIPTAQTTATVHAMGDAGSEWGIGGHDDHTFFKAPWPADLWEDVQRDKSSSSLHMEAIQLLVMARVMAHTWGRSRVVIELDSLGLTAIHRKGRHPHPGINAILTELTNLQLQHGFTIETRWVRRCHNEAADALSKNDMPRFWSNIQGTRTEIELKPQHLARPAHAKTAGMRRTKAQQQEWDTRPPRQVAPPILPLKGPGKRSLAQLVDDAMRAHDRQADPLHTTRTGVNHYLRFCARTGRQDDVAPTLARMAEHTKAWMADAVQAYKDPTTGRLKKALSVTSLPTYLCHIEHWYAIVTGSPRGLLAKDAGVAQHRRFITANYRSANRQVHGITYDALLQLVAAAATRNGPTRRLLVAAYTMAWFALLRPTEYMTTPQHATFDPARHLRAGDVTFWKQRQRVTHGAESVPDRMVINVKQSKTDMQRMGANLIVGATGGPACPVAAVWKYTQRTTLAPEGPLFPGLRYQTMLATTRTLIGPDAELYGMHSFRVGGAQAMALAGRSPAYIMGRGRWKHLESVSRYVEAPDDLKADDARAMAITTDQRAAGRDGTDWRKQHTHDMERLLPRGRSQLVMQ